MLLLLLLRWSRKWRREIVAYFKYSLLGRFVKYVCPWRHMGSGGIVPLIFLGTRMKWLRIFTSQLPYPEGKGSGTHLVEGWILWGAKFLAIPGSEQWVHCCPAHKVVTIRTELSHIQPSWKLPRNVKTDILTF